MHEPDPALTQSAYQIRLDWGLDGLDRLAPADVVIFVDVLGRSTAMIDALGAGPAGPDAADRAVSDDEGLADAAAARGGRVALAGLRNAAAVAEWVLRVQHERAARTSISIVAAGELSPGWSGVRFAVEDLLGAGAVIAALGDRGIDHCSPDAAAAGEAFRALRGACRHLLAASGTGRQWHAAGRADEVAAASSIDASTVVPVLVDGVFVAA